MKKGNNELKIKVTPLSKDDKKMAELFQAYYDENMAKFEGVIGAISVARVTLEEICPLIKSVGDGIWDRILIEIVKMEIDEKLGEPDEKRK